MIIMYVEDAPADRVWQVAVWGDAVYNFPTLETAMLFYGLLGGQ